MPYVKNWLADKDLRDVEKGIYWTALLISDKNIRLIIIIIIIIIVHTNNYYSA